MKYFSVNNETQIASDFHNWNALAQTWKQDDSFDEQQCGNFHRSGITTNFWTIIFCIENVPESNEIPM